MKLECGDFGVDAESGDQRPRVLVTDFVLGDRFVVVVVKYIVVKVDKVEWISVLLAICHAFN